MHSPPATRYIVGRSPSLQWALLGLMALNLTAAVMLWGHAFHVWGAMVLLWCVGASAFWGWWHHQPRVEQLHWDGARWHWLQGAQRSSGRLVLHMDFQNVLMVSLHSSELPTQWLWLEKRAGQGDWPALRRATVAGLGDTDISVGPEEKE